MANKNAILVIFLICTSILFTIGSAQPVGYRRLPLANANGPESIAFDCNGDGPYTGVSDGRILKWLGRNGGWTEFAVTNPQRSRLCDGLNDSPYYEQYCGRPLGLRFDMSTCDLYIADSSFGLMKVGRNGGVAVPISQGFAGVSFRFLNALDVDSESGAVYFTDTSTNYHRWEYGQAMRNFDRTGRLMKYDPKTKDVTVLLDHLAFANGVALSKNKDFVLVAETTANQIRRHWLTGPRAGTSDIFAHLTGRPDNINRNSRGDFWVAQNPTKPVKLDQFGHILQTLQSPEVIDVSDVTEFNNMIWIGSVVHPHLLYH